MIQSLMLQVELLRHKLPGDRVILAPEDRARLLQVGQLMNHQVHDVMGIVSVKTYRRWVREQAEGRTAGRVGRPKKVTASLRTLILRLARENAGWGVRRILGELRKLAMPSSRSTVRRVLVDEGVLPDPNRHAPKGVDTPWRTFLAAHLDCMVATDFFCKTATSISPALPTTIPHMTLASHMSLTRPPSDPTIQSLSFPPGQWNRTRENTDGGDV